MNGGDDIVIPPNVPDQCRACWLALMTISKSVREIEEEQAVVKAKAGSIQFPPSVWISLAALLIALGGGFVNLRITLDRNSQQVLALAVAVDKATAELKAHADMPWHGQTGQKFNSIDQRERDLDERLRELERARGKGGQQ